MKLSMIILLIAKTTWVNFTVITKNLFLLYQRQHSIPQQHYIQSLRDNEPQRKYEKCFTHKTWACLIELILWFQTQWIWKSILLFLTFCVSLWYENVERSGNVFISFWLLHSCIRYLYLHNFKANISSNITKK